MKIFAVGNALYGDDGIGAAVLQRVREDGLAPDAELIDVETDALALIDHFAPDEKHVIIDAAKMGCEPGRVRRFTHDEAHLRIQWDHLSLHGFGLAETFDLAKKIGSLPEQIVILGVEPAEIRIDQGLTDAVAAAIPEVLALIQAEVLNDVPADHPHH